MLLSAGAFCTAPVAVDRYFLHAWRSAANPLAAVTTVDQWDRRTDACPLHRALHPYKLKLCLVKVMDEE